MIEIKRVYLNNEEKNDFLELMEKCLTLQTSELSKRIVRIEKTNRTHLSYNTRNDNRADTKNRNKTDILN